MDKPSLSVQQEVLSHLEAEIWIKNVKLSLRLQFGVWNGAQLQQNTINPIAQWDAGTKIFTILTVMDKKKKNSVKDTLHVTQFQLTIIIQGSIS